MMKKRRFNWVVSDGIRKWFKFYYETSARLRGQHFTVRRCTPVGLQPHHQFDLTVSCNCQDYDGPGTLVI